MSSPKEQGIAEDASEYEDLMDEPSPKEGRSPSGGGIADDASLFEGLVEETSDGGRAADSDWLYQVDGQVFGPVKPKEILEMLYEGELNADTMVAVEDDEFQPLRRIGAFRVHLPKVQQHHAEREAAEKAEKAETKRRIVRRLSMLAVAIGVLAGGSWALINYIRESRQRAAAAEKAAKEAALEKELENLFASVTIEPPLMPLVEEPPPSKKGAAKKRRRRRRRRTMSSTGELKREEVMAGVGKVFGGFKRCIVEQIQRDSESVPETIVLTFAIGNNGRAKNISLRDRILRRSPMLPCMQRQLGKAKWRAFKGEVQNVEYPITIGRR